MNGIDKILENIRTQTKEICEGIIKEAKAKSEKQMSAELETAQAKADAELEQAKKDAVSLVDGAKSTAALEKKKMILSAKRQIVDEVLDRSALAFRQMDKDVYKKFLAKLALSFNGGVLTFSQQDKALADDVMKLIDNGAFSLSAETAEIKSGFILKNGSVEAECSVETIIGEMRRELEPEISKILF